MRKCQIENGRVVNVYVVDPRKIPEEVADWPESDSAGPGWSYDGTNFLPPPDPTQQEIDDRVASEIDAILGDRRALRTVTEALWQVARAAKTDDWSFFSSVNNKADFRDLLILIHKNGG